MKRLLQIEFIKLFTYTGFWVPALFWAVLYVLCLFFGTQININIPGLDTEVFFKFPALWNTTTWLASWFNLLLAIMAMIFICNEFSFKTFRQHVIDGLSRSELFFSKVLLLLVFAFVGLILVVVSTIILGLFHNTSETWPLMFDTLYFPFVYFVQAFAYMSFAMMIALMIKNIGLSILAFFGYFTLEMFYCFISSSNMDAFFPMNVISHLTPAPDVFQVSTNAQFTTTINGQIVNDTPSIPFEIPLWGNTIVAVGYIALFLTTSWYILKKKKL